MVQRACIQLLLVGVWQDNSKFFSFSFLFTANEKSHPPKLNDSVHRLEEIAKVYAERLEKENIFTVEHFLKALNKDPCNLAEVNSTFFY